MGSLLQTSVRKPWQRPKSGDLQPIPGHDRNHRGLFGGAESGYVSLTGNSRNRGAIIQRFNDEDDCRVYVDSPRAGGTGIDLVAASVVFHYDRWWNAAREDQATDRVHRIGQRAAFRFSNS